MEIKSLYKLEVLFQLENGNKSSFINWGKSPIGKMEIKVPLRIGSIILIRKWK